MSSTKKWFGRSPAALFGVDEVERNSALDVLRGAVTIKTPRFQASLQSDDEIAHFLSKIMVLSPYLRGAILRFCDNFEILFDRGIEARLLDLFAQLDASKDAAEKHTETQLMAHLRAVKSEAHLLIALGDLAQAFDVAKTTDLLTHLSDKTLSAAINWLLVDMHDAGKITLSDPSNPSHHCGLVILGMGKMGGFELNYSSDIDIVVYFENEASGLKYADNQDPTELLGRMVRRLVRIMQERTGDGYVFRTDLRLRPDPGATPLAINVDAALNYYESRGQNWERAAFIKARPVAGDIEAGERFIKDLKPFIWRKYLDYAAISDVQSIKRQIHASKGHGKIAVHGHNLKLGRGGIREIEFFVQTQQLIAGGRAVQLRSRQTVEMLSRLAEAKWISGDVRDTLSKAYAFLRRAEHAVQMIGDEQTHNLPQTDEGLWAVSGLLGYADLETFKAELKSTLRAVEKHFSELFEDEESLSSKTGNLVFTGEDPDPDTLANLSAMGFARPADMWSIVRTWHFGRYRALQSSKAREQLTAMVPTMLECFAQSGQADETLLRFDAVMAGLPAGVQVLSMLNSNRHLLTLLTTILSAAPRLADIITKRPLIFDGMLDPAFFDALPSDEDVKNRLDGFLFDSTGYEESLDRLRIFASEQRFLIGVRLLTGSIDADQTGAALSNLADHLLTVALDLACKDVASKHGLMQGAELCLVAMGRLGSQEMTAGSDVDLLLIYDGVDDSNESDGPKPIAASQYFARVTQRLIAALSAPTAEGVLYEVDFRLRPSGNKGPLATSMAAFSKYQHNEAWTWEHMALTRARVVSGDKTLRIKVDNERETILCAEKDVAKIIQDIADMRARLLRDKPASSIWDLKMSRGGILDIEFLTQFWMLTALPNCKAALPNRNLNYRRAKHILGVSGQELVNNEDKQTLLDALNVFTLIDHLIKLCSTQAFSPSEAPKGLVEQLCAATNMPDIAQLEAHLVEYQNAVAEIFDRVLPLKADERREA